MMLFAEEDVLTWLLGLGCGWVAWMAFFLVFGVWIAGFQVWLGCLGCSQDLLSSKMSSWMYPTIFSSFLLLVSLNFEFEHCWCVQIGLVTRPFHSNMNEGCLVSAAEAPQVALQISWEPVAYVKEFFVLGLITTIAWLCCCLCLCLRLCISLGFAFHVGNICKLGHMIFKCGFVICVGMNNYYVAKRPTPMTCRVHNRPLVWPRSLSHVVMNGCGLWCWLCGLVLVSLGCVMNAVLCIRVSRRCIVANTWFWQHMVLTHLAPQLHAHGLVLIWSNAIPSLPHNMSFAH